LSWADADDAVQITFEKILNGIATYNPDEGVLGWLWTIHYHVIQDFFRASKRKQTEPIDNQERFRAPQGKRGKWTEHFVDWVEEAQKEKEEQCKDVALNRISDEDLKDLRRRGRGPGRREWHDAVQRFLEVYHQCLEGRL
jgi:DNA-directed RNA polymerase specialized sigma24 family protein